MCPCWYQGLAVPAVGTGAWQDPMSLWGDCWHLALLYGIEGTARPPSSPPPSPPSSRHSLESGLISVSLSIIEHIPCLYGCGGWRAHPAGMGEAWKGFLSREGGWQCLLWGLGHSLVSNRQPYCYPLSVSSLAGPLCCYGTQGARDNLIRASDLSAPPYWHAGAGTDPCPHVGRLTGLARTGYGALAIPTGAVREGCWQCLPGKYPLGGMGRLVVGARAFLCLPRSTMELRGAWCLPGRWGHAFCQKGGSGSACWQPWGAARGIMEMLWDDSAPLEYPKVGLVPPCLLHWGCSQEGTGVGSGAWQWGKGITDHLAEGSCPRGWLHRLISSNPMVPS